MGLDAGGVLDLDWSPSTLEQRTGRVDRIAGGLDHEGRTLRLVSESSSQVSTGEVSRGDIHDWVDVGEDVP